MAMNQRVVTDGDAHFLRLVLTDLTLDFTGQYACGTLTETVLVSLLVTGRLLYALRKKYERI